MRIVIPARMASQRLPNKPLALIGGKPMIQHVWENACKTNIPVTIATDEPKIKKILPDADVLITKEANTGSDRVALVLEKYNDDVIINCQGDLPFIKPDQILSSVIALNYANVGTLVTEMSQDKMQDPNSVKAICTGNGKLLKCHWFCRSSLQYGYHHIGVYAYRRNTLKSFAKQAQSFHENIEKLEQLRFFDMDEPIFAVKISNCGIEVNTKEDLNVANEY